MGKKYKLVITSGDINREAELPDDDISIRVGTTVRCDIRIAQLATKEPVELEMSRRDGIWTIECPEGLYFTDGGVRKQIRKQLDHGDTVFVFLQSQAKSICTIDFMLDFDSRAKKYDRMIDIRNVNNLVIGGHPTAAVYIEDPLLETDFITIVKKQGKLYLADFNARYGAYINGVRVEGERELKDTDFFSVVGYSFYYKDGFLYTDSGNGIRINGLRSFFDGVYSGNMEYPKFVRNVRKKIVLSEEEITVLDPPQKPQKPKNNILMQLLPAMGSLVLVVLLRGVMGGGGSFVIFSACSMALGMVTTVISFITGNKDYNKEVEERESEYSDYIGRKRKEIEAARKSEIQQLSQIYIPVQEQLKRIRTFSGDLFDRQKDDDDFLCVRLGDGKQEALRPIKITVKESITAADEMAKIPQRIADEYKYIPNAPIYVDLKNDNAIGIVGDSRRQLEMLKIMTLDIASRHYHNDVELVYVLGDEHIESLRWLRWLPHVENELLVTTAKKAELVKFRNIVCDEASKGKLFEFLFEELEARSKSKRRHPHYVVFVLDDRGMKRHPVSEYVSRAKDLGFTFVFFEKRQELMPQGVDEVVTLERGGNRGTIINVSNVNDIKSFSYAPIRDADLEQAALVLSPIYSEEVSLENTLRKSITLFELLGVFSPEDIDLDGNWMRSAVERSLAVPFGVKANDETEYLDIHENAHGPHGLVAGTTGSGKSETLQSYIISAALLFHPHEVTFLIVDFKGGGMANQFRNLPHMVGAITNLDGGDLNEKEIDRALQSIEAELKKRQDVFAAAGVNSINDYIRLYKNGSVRIPIPHLIIVVDEFAELKMAYPESLARFVSASRIGRSLGVHLILATQNPSGNVSEEIQQNSKFRLCLKMRSPGDSQAVLNSPLAAEIREVGRAYLKVGHNEIFELFQSAYSGGPANADTGGKKETFSIVEVSMSGKRQLVFEQRLPKGASGGPTQLGSLVEYIKGYCRKNGLVKLPDICPPPLPKMLPYQNEKTTEETAVCISVGIYDNPAGQYQGPVEINLTSENLFAVGSSQMGKTNLLQTVVRGLAENYSPEEVSIYIIDFGSMILKNFEKMAHVGGVVTRTDEEALKNLMKLLLGEISRRKDSLLNVGVSSYAAYREAGLKDIPQIVLLIDNMTALREALGNDEDVLKILCQEGVGVGVSLVVVNGQTSGIGYKYLSSFGSRMAFFCHDSGEYSSLFSYGHKRPENRAGSCLIGLNKSIYDGQVYLAFEGEKEIERVQAMREFSNLMNRKYAGMRGASRIPVIPKILTEEIVLPLTADRSPYQIPVGLDYERVEPVLLDLERTGIMGMSGKRGMGQSNFIHYMLHLLEENREKAPVSVCIIDGIEKRFADLEALNIVHRYTLAPDAVLEVVAQWEEMLQNRYDMLLAGETAGLEKEPLLLLILNNADVAMIINSHPEALSQYKSITEKFKSLKVCVIYAGMNNAAIYSSAPDPIKPLKESHNFLYFDNISTMRFFDPPPSVLKKYKKEIAPGDCYFTRGDAVYKVKTVLFEK